MTPPLPPATDAERLAHEVPTECLNCGAVLPGAFCPACGQKAEARRRSLGAMAREVGSDFLGLDGRLWRTLAALLVRPGHLTRAYLDGRRTRYLRPFRLYLSASLAFFFLLSLLDPTARLERSIAEGGGDTTEVVPAARIAEIDSLLAADALPAERVEAQIADSIRVAFDATAAGPSPDWERRVEDFATATDVRWRRRVGLERRLLAALPPDTTLHPDDVAQAVAALAPADAKAAAGVNVPGPFAGGRIASIIGSETRGARARAIGELVRDAIRRVPTVMFVLLPLFAGLLKLLYVRRGWYYAEHIVFALHTHAFAFVVFALALALLVADSTSTTMRSVVLSGTTVVIPLYFLIAQKRVYGQSWRKTLVKALLLGFAYLNLLTLGLIGAAALAALR